MSLAVGGDPLAQPSVIAGDGDLVERHIPGCRGGGHPQPEQTGNLLEPLGAHAASLTPVGELLAASLALAAPVGQRVLLTVVATGALDVPVG